MGGIFVGTDDAEENNRVDEEFEESDIINEKGNENIKSKPIPIPNPNQK